MEYKKLVSFITAVRIGSGPDVLTNSLKNNFGIQGLKDMIDSVYETSKYKGEGDYGYEICLKLDECDTEGIELVNSELTDTQKKFTKWTITSRRSHLMVEMALNPRWAHNKIDHIWLNDAFKISEKSKFYWIWNHSHIMMKENWDEYLFNSKELWHKPWTTEHSGSPDGIGTLNYSPVLHYDFVKEKQNPGEIAGESPADNHWQTHHDGESTECDMNLQINILEASTGAGWFWNEDYYDSENNISWIDGKGWIDSDGNPLPPGWQYELNK